MNNSFMYNMYNPVNPAFTEDIYTSMINRMYPTVLDPITGMPDLSMAGISINSGQPFADSYVTPKQKREWNIIKNIAAGLILGGLCFFGYKKGTAKLKKIFADIKGFFGGKKSTPPVPKQPRNS